LVFKRGSGWSAAFDPTYRKPAATPTPPPDPSCATAGWSQRIRRDLAVMEDAIALIDAMLDAGHRPFIEQISFSEGFRLYQARVAEIRPLFQHYFRRSTKRYMALAHRSVVETSA
jgi:hypothetical protein